MPFLRTWRSLYGLALLAASLPSPGVAAGIINGDFETGDFSGWQLDSDGFDGADPDFQVVGVPGNHQARVEIDFAADFGIFANTLYQPLDLSAAPGMELVLSFEWAFTGVDNSDLDDYFVVGFSNPSGGFFNAVGEQLPMLEVDVYLDNGSYSAVLAQSYNNATDWVLEFQINTGGNGFGSYLLLDNVALAERQAAGVPEPALLFPPALALALWLGRRTGRRAAV
jgi:hypothetical protein